MPIYLTVFANVKYHHFQMFIYFNFCIGDVYIKIIIPLIELITRLKSNKKYWKIDKMEVVALGFAMSKGISFCWNPECSVNWRWNGTDPRKWTGRRDGVV